MTDDLLSNLSPQALIAEYILQCKGQGQFLGYDEYAVIEEWLSSAGNPDVLLLALSEIIPERYAEDRRKGRKPRALTSLREKVLRGLRSLE